VAGFGILSKLAKPAAAIAAVPALTPEEAEAGIILGALKEGRRIGQRYPTATSATESPFDPSLVIDTKAIDAGGNLEGTVAAAVRDMPGIKTKAKSTTGLLNAYQDQMADNLQFLYGQTPTNVVDVAKNWYRGANQLASGLSNKYGVSIEQASGVLASLSPQKDWYQNVSLADRVFAAYNSGIKAGNSLPDKKHSSKLKELYSGKQYSEDVREVLRKPFSDLSGVQKAMWVRSHDQAFSDRGYDIISPTGESMGPALTGKGERATTAWGPNNVIAKAINLIENGDIDNISSKMGEKHKVRNFYNNIVSPEYAKDMTDVADVTMDTHAVAAGQLMPLSGTSPAVAANFGTGAPGSAITGASGTYGINADAYRMAAQQSGIMPREMQSVTWESVRNLFPKEFKSASNKAEIEGIWNDYSKGRINLDTARSLILEKAGGVDAPNWATGRSSANDAGSTSPVQQSNLPQPGLLGPSSNGMDRRTGSGPSSSSEGSIDPRLLGGIAATSAATAAAAPTLADQGAGIMDFLANAAQGAIAPIANAPNTIIQALTSDRSNEQLKADRDQRLDQNDYQLKTDLGQQYTQQALQSVGGLIKYLQDQAEQSRIVNAAKNSRILQTIPNAYNQLPERGRIVGNALLDSFL